ncbi:LCP family protein [Leucobacter salsicius]|uniref:LCP family protein n=1 Tax=Leucobacter salsicius TaxID=664638 RepID=UPI00047613BD|nr:LCP family protein [Leucobacter salsicius]
MNSAYTPTELGGARPARKRRRGLRNLLIAVGVLIALLVIAAGIGYALLSSSYNEVRRFSIHQDPSLTRPAAVAVADGMQAPINILLLGSDSRESTDPLTNVEDLTGFRSDAMMVAQVSPDREVVTIVSIMRDNWVPIQGFGEAKINAAFSLGGLPLAVNTVENFIGARIDHVALVDFQSFKGLTDAVGGVTVHNSQAFTAQNGGGGFTFAEGDITLNGDQALSFVRERYAFADGDYQRARNQQAYLQGLMKQVLSKGTLTDATKLMDTFNALKSYLILDEELDLPEAMRLGFDMRTVRADTIEFFTSPTLGTGTSTDGQSIVLPNWAEIANMQAAFQSGTLAEFAALHGPGSELP